MTTTNENLRKLSIDERMQEVREERKNQERQQLEEKEAKLFFNLPTALPDYDSWAKRDYWLLEEAVALFLNRSPNIVNLKALSSVQRHPFATQYQDLLETLKRSCIAKEIECIHTSVFVKLESIGIKPLDFIAWAERKKIPVPSELKEKVEAYHQLEAADTIMEEKKALSQEVERLKQEIEILKESENIIRAANRDRMLIAMAKEKYGYDPNKKRDNDNPCQKIADDVRDVTGKTVSAETVRKYLKDCHLSC